MAAYLVVVAAWTGSDGAQHMPTDLAQSASAAEFFPFSLREFFADYYDKTILRVNHTRTGFDPEVLWARRDFGRNMQALAADEKLRLPGPAMKSFDPELRNIEELSKLEPEAAAALLETKLANGSSFMLSFEHISAAHRPLVALEDALFNLTGIPASIHLYCSAAGAKVLKPHTDPYDVLVWQLVGSKSWRACVPRKEIASDAQLSDAQRCLLQELARDNIEGCTTYRVEDTAAFVCDEFTMAPGDVLYMPKGVVHYATTAESVSFHLTIGLHRDNRQWLDVFHHMLTGMAPPDGADSPPDRATELELMELYAGSVQGVHMHEAVPGWLLACLRPWALEGGDGGEARAEAAGCDALDTELRRIFRLHLERFGLWLLQLRQRGPWKLALSVAEEDKVGGERAELGRVARLLWWQGDLGFLEALHADAAALRAALAHVAQVVTHADTAQRRWKRRGRASRSVRAAGEEGERSLCDELEGWSVECRGSSTDRCEAHVPRTTSCQEYCRERGFFCEAGWDDRDGACQRATLKPSERASCFTSRKNQICACRRSCVDDGPWDCVEEGCPARSVSCELLAGHCKWPFNGIWRKPPHGTAGLLVEQACPATCKLCGGTAGDDDA